jgi:hypothetical protein
MRVFTAVLCASLCAAPALAQAQTWRPIARQCAEAIDRQAHCAACGGEWPEWTRCLNARLHQVPPALLEECIKQTWDARMKDMTPAVVGDPVAQAWYCAGGGQ